MRHRALSIAAATLALATLAVPQPSWAQSFPSRPITLIVAFPAGGAGDLVMRAMADVASKQLGQPIVVENRVGASGTLGPATMVAGAKPDGYTISQTAITVLRVPLMQKAVYDPLKDFTWIANLTGYTFGVVSKNGGPFKTWDDVVQYAKANPGKVTYATPGAGTTLHLGMEQIAAQAGIQLKQVPMKGAGESSAAVLGEHVMLQADATNWKPLVAAGELRALVVWTDVRSPSLPDVPTLKELGYPFVFDSPFGIAGPKGMDPAVVTKLQDAFKASLADANVQATMVKFDMVPRYMSAAEYTKWAADTFKSEQDTITKLGLGKKD
jgi:tripartite-type tricarboxylate transporter receptor subunit TctC